ncbi:hypothetical protein TNCV_1689801 [Trichonephila clavipes]|nr:hypothetical protein TNCV_1689801 [Trichonephila clavipes]
MVANGTMTGQRYIDDLLPHVRLFRGAVGDTFVFMDDNATYLNPIENVWDALGRQVAGRNYPPTNKNTLIRALTEEWDKLPQQLLDNVVQIIAKANRIGSCKRLTGINESEGIIGIHGGFERKREDNDSDGRGSERRDIRTREKRQRTQERQTLNDIAAIKT